MKARGKRVSASPLDRSPKKSQALKVRNRSLSLSYYALSELRNKSALNQGRRATLSLRACPWLSYHAPLALHDLQFRLLRQGRLLHKPSRFPPQFIMRRGDADRSEALPLALRPKRLQSPRLEDTAAV